MVDCFRDVCSKHNYIKRVVVNWFRGLDYINRITTVGSITDTINAIGTKRKKKFHPDRS